MSQVQVPTPSAMDRQVTLRNLTPLARLATIRERAQTQEIAWLRDMRLAGWFDAPENIHLGCPSETRPFAGRIFRRDALNSIAALSGVLMSADDNEPHEFEPIAVSISSEFSAGLQMVARQFFNTFDVRQANGACDEEGAFERREWTPEERAMAHKVRTSTAQVLLQLACAIDSAATVELVLAQCPQALDLYTTSLIWGDVATPKKGVARVHAAVTAIQFSSHAALSALQHHGWEPGGVVAHCPREMEIRCFDDPRKSPLNNEATLADLLAQDILRPNAAMADRVLRELIRDEDGQISPHDHRPLMQCVAKLLSAPHWHGNAQMYLDIFVDNEILSLDPRRSVWEAAKHGRLDVLQSMDTSVPWHDLLTDSSKHILLNLAEHIGTIEQRRKNEEIACFVMERAKMEGAGEDIYSENATNRAKILELAVERRWHRVLALYLHNGTRGDDILDSGQSLSDFVLEFDDQVAIDLVNMAIAFDTTSELLVALAMRSDASNDPCAPSLAPRQIALEVAISPQRRTKRQSAKLCRKTAAI